MRVKELLTDDDAVSPVIGVILMVAITVILAAVIASFVLGLGDTAGDVQPNTSFEFDNGTLSGASSPVLNITVTNGDQPELALTSITGSGINPTTGSQITDLNPSSSTDVRGSSSGSTISGDRWSVGEKAVIATSAWVPSDGGVRVVWSEEGSNEAATIGEADLS